MKRTITIIALGLFLMASTQSWAQEQGQIRASASLAMGTEAAINDAGDSKLGMGINIGGDYFVIDKLSIAPSYTFFFKSTYGSNTDLGNAELSVKSSSFNIDGKYYLLDEAVKLYGLFGISFASAKVTADFLGTPIDIKDNKTGKFTPSCSTIAGDGMDIDVSSLDVVEMRQSALNLLLSEHSGDCEAPCTIACPAHATVEEYVQAGKNGEFLKSLQIIKGRIPLPMSIGRVCPRFCEIDCRRNVEDKPVAINDFKRLAADLHYE